MATKSVLVLLAISCSAVLADLMTHPLDFQNSPYYSRAVPFRDAKLDTYNVSPQCNAEISRLINGDPRTLEKDIVMGEFYHQGI